MSEVESITVDEPIESIESIETNNDHLVAAQGSRVSILAPPVMSMERDEALRMAAWLILCADQGRRERFEQIYEAICNA